MKFEGATTGVGGTQGASNPYEVTGNKGHTRKLRLNEQYNVANMLAGIPPQGSSHNYNSNVGDGSDTNGFNA